MSNHIADTNKMVSDTPRTTDRVVFIDGNPWVNAPFARGLERELNEANDRVMLLEEAGIVAIHEAIHGREDDALEIWRKAMNNK